jgi:hypothetical protein
MLLLAGGQFCPLQDEADHPRNVHRWVIIQGTDPAHWELISMRLVLLDLIDDRQQRFDALQRVKKALKHTAETMELGLRESYGGFFKNELNATNRVLQEKTAQLVEMEARLKQQKPMVLSRERQVRNAQSDAREWRLEKSDDRQRWNEIRLAVGESGDQPIRPPKFPATKRAPGRFVGGGFGVGKVDVVTKAEAVEVPRLDLAEIELQRIKMRPHTSSGKAVVLPGTSKRGNNQNWSARPRSHRVQRE